MRYDPAEQRVYINAAQHVAPVPESVLALSHWWVSGLREVAQGSAGAGLELDNIRTYCRIVTALKITIDIQEQIDAPYPEIEKEPLSGLSKA